MIVLYLTAVISSLSALTWAIYASRLEAIRASETHLATLSRTLGENVARTLDASRQAADTILEHPQFHLDFERRDMVALHTNLKARLKTLQHMRSWNIIDRDGAVLMSTFQTTPPKVNAADRPYFKHSQSHDELWIDSPVSSRIGGNWIIPMARAIRDKDGNFSGVLMGTYNPAYLTKFYTDIANDQELIIMIVNNEGNVMIRHPFLDSAMAHNIQNQSIWKSLKNQPDKPAIGPDPLDGVDRHYIYWNVENSPLSIVMGVSKDVMLQHWWRDTKLKTVYVVTILFVTGLLLLFLLRQINRLGQSEQARQHLANYDPLTKLPNRRMLYDKMAYALLLAERQTFPLAVLVLDLDNFKTLNDSSGHSSGDMLLGLVAERLQGTVRKSDLLARVGGDEFVIVLIGLASPLEATKIARAIQTEISKPFQLKHGEFNTTVSIGISIFPEDGQDVESLIRNADTAMYQAKAVGKNNAQFYLSGMNDRLAERLSIESNLRRAIANQEFVLFYQAQVSLETGALVGAEALIRWKSPTGFILPGKFIPVAEDSRLIIPLGNWVINEACRQIREWLDQGLPPIRVAVNLSPLQFQQPDLLETVQHALNQHRIPRGTLEIEVTESVMTQDIDRVIVLLSDLKLMGVDLSIDDFGTGYSSLSYLKRFKVDKLKIDQSFVRGLGSDKNDEAITLAIIRLAKTLGLKVLAEGVETEHQLAFLRDNGCEEFQGYLAHRPAPASEFAALLTQCRDPRFLLLPAYGSPCTPPPQLAICMG
ncbi:MAG: EAL domain-containing protein [Pseudomonadota bacterium]